MEIKIDFEELRKRPLFLGLPCYGGQCAALFSRSVADLAAVCAQIGIPLQMYYLMNESLITRARAYICDEFLRSGAKHLMFIDSDIGFNSRDVIAMLALQSDDTQYDVLGAAYPKKCISWEKIKRAVDKGVADQDPTVLEKYVGDYVFNPKTGTNSIPIGEPSEVLETGTGFMMIRRQTLERYADSYPERRYRPDHIRTEAFDGSREITMFFDCYIDQVDFARYYEQEMKRIASLRINNPDVLEKEINAVFVKAQQENVGKSKRYLSEDYAFCYDCQKIGMKVWLCPWIELQHVGTYTFGGSLAALASIGATATASPEELGKKPAITPVPAADLKLIGKV